MNSTLFLKTFLLIDPAWWTVIYKVTLVSRLDDVLPHSKIIPSSAFTDSYSTQSFHSYNSTKITAQIHNPNNHDIVNYIYVAISRI
ncbi:hypothetical protein XELAEV_18041737mg [Xenopus laevis]|uniref:Uncharacterized protein n=1 Tax=Xenopus laevis TaxID=8355 RepID=A0A974C2T4_XENLA|nr:hypothetical protein XELAEV_18041737mg [Xenopus laevis]